MALSRVIVILIRTDFDSNIKVYIGPKSGMRTNIPYYNTLD